MDNNDQNLPPTEEPAISGNELTYDSQQIVALSQPSILKGECSIVSFSAEDGTPLGALWGKDGEVTFTGNVEESAQVFFSVLKQYLENWKDECVADAILAYQDHKINTTGEGL